MIIVSIWSSYEAFIVPSFKEKVVINVLFGVLDLDVNHVFGYSCECNLFQLKIFGAPKISTLIGKYI
jgi:hypothetical protein